MKRHLVLAKETLVRLSPDDLAEVNGASATYYGCPTGYTGLTRCGLCDPGTYISGSLCESLLCPTRRCAG